MSYPSFQNVFFGLAAQQDFHHLHQSAGDLQRALQDAAAIMPMAACDQAKQTIMRWSGYQPTPLHSLNRLAAACNIAAISYKDEAGRFGLGSFKALGGAYAVFKLAANALGMSIDTLWQHQMGGIQLDFGDLTVITATDGNHGRSVAWGAQQLGLPCVIYMHAGVSEFRADYVRRLGATVKRVAGNYDASVDQAQADADAHAGWHVVSDTSYPGYVDIPADIMHGYSVMCAEIADDLPAPPTHVFICAGCGGLAASVVGYLAQRWQHALPRWVIVEPSLAPSLHLSAQHRQAMRYAIAEETLMAGLSCGETSLIAWQVLREQAIDYVLLDDHWVHPIMQLLVAEGLEAGETSIATAAALIGCSLSTNMRATLGIDAASRVVIFGTEGATDPEVYQQLLGFSATDLHQHQGALAQKFYG